MPETIEVCYVESDAVACDGGCGPLGHPRVYLAIDHTGRVTCGYCGRLFVRDPDRAGQSQLMSPHEAASVEGVAPPPRH
ncbi:MAG TPA: zinc-finger domain-containing protein [Geminicoccaceae bacterium]|nr:zinc-finger domain-containing protein [Geminicoccaceae bacterium]